MQVTPAHLNGAIACAVHDRVGCFAMGSVPAYLNAVGGPVDGVDLLRRLDLLHLRVAVPAGPGADPGDGRRDAAARPPRPAPVRWLAWLPHDRGWLAAVTQFPGTLFFNVITFAALAHNATVAQVDQRHVWRPDIYGSILFLVSSVFGLLAVAAGRRHAGGHAALADRLVEHDRLDLLHGLGVGELHPAERGAGEHPDQRRRHVPRRDLLPGRRCPAVPCLAGSSDAAPRRRRTREACETGSSDHHRPARRIRSADERKL